MYKFHVNSLIPNIAFAIAGCAREIIENNVPHLKNDFSNLSEFECKIGFDQEIVIIEILFRDGGVPVIGIMQQDKFIKIKSEIKNLRRYEDLKKNINIRDYFDWNKTLIVADVQYEEVIWKDIAEAVRAWLSDVPLGRALSLNRRRVQSAIPAPPQYDLRRMQDALWVLECNDTCVQGSAFDLGSEVITNDHVVRGAKNMVAFRAGNPEKKYNIDVIKSNSVVDLAIIRIVDAVHFAPLEEESESLSYMAHIAVCGFPNYRLGDSGVLIPGLVIGTRNISGIQRMLTNASIIAGMSGGPVIGSRGAVVGVCVTGADNFQSAPDTEAHGIIPISALSILRG